MLTAYLVLLCEFFWEFSIFGFCRPLVDIYWHPLLRGFLERERGYIDAQNVEFQRVHRTGKTKEENPRPILARFLRFKDVQKIFSLGHRLKESKFQMFRDLPTEIVKRRGVQMETFKTAKRRGIPAAFSQAQPDKLYIRGRL